MYFEKNIEVFKKWFTEFWEYGHIYLKGAGHWKGMPMISIIFKDDSKATREIENLYGLRRPVLEVPDDFRLELLMNYLKKKY